MFWLLHSHRMEKKFTFSLFSKCIDDAKARIKRRKWVINQNLKLAKNQRITAAAAVAKLFEYCWSVIFFSFSVTFNI